MTLAPKTRKIYADLYDHHLAPYLGHVALRDLEPDVVARWQADRLTAGAGRTAVRQALDLLDVRANTLLIERALSLGAEADTKTSQHRTVRLLAPLKADPQAWRLVQGRPPDDALLFPGRDGTPVSVAAYQGTPSTSSRTSRASAPRTRSAARGPRSPRRMFPLRSPGTSPRKRNRPQNEKNPP